MDNYRTSQKITYTRRDFLQIAGIASVSLCGVVNLGGCKRNSAEDEMNYYIQKKDKLLEDFDDLSGIVKNIFLENFSASTVSHWMAEAKEDYRRIIPQIPYIGGDENKLTRQLVLSSALMPYLTILKGNGVDTRQTGKIIFDAATIYFQNEIIKPMRWLLGWYALSGFNQNATIKSAERTQLRKYPEDWVMEFVEGEKGNFEYGVNYTECGLVKYYADQGLQEFVPYLCLTDYPLLALLGIELRRTQTLANGGLYCDFRFVKRGPGPLGWPPESLPEWTGRKGVKP